MAGSYGAVIRMRQWFARFERPISTLSLIGGFVFDAVTLKRVDLFWENFWVIVHLLVVAVCIVLINREENEGQEAVLDSTDPAKLHFWLVNILQFFFGGLLSTFIVFYFRSAVLAVAWPFFLILALAFIANESMKRHYTRIAFQISNFFLCLFLFSIFSVPILLHQTGSDIFLMSGGISLIVLLIFLGVLRFFAKERFKKSKDMLLASIVGIYIVVNGLYFAHLIPPLPLSLQDAGIYHSIARTAEGDYAVTYEEGDFWSKYLPYVNIYPTYHTTENGLVYAYSAVFSPVAFNEKIIQEWQYFDPTTKKWITNADIDLPVTGGRENGYRTYSINAGLVTGKWRVNVQTSTGQLIGRMVFQVVVQDTVPELSVEIKK